jgi:hypothetical protein
LTVAALLKLVLSYAMAVSSAVVCRGLALVFMALAGGMLLWGQTVLASRLAGRTFIIYWTLCFLFAGLALIFSVMEIFRLRRGLYRQQKDLLRKTLEEIDRESARHNKPHQE